MVLEIFEKAQRSKKDQEIKRLRDPEAVVYRCYVKKVFLKISQKKPQACNFILKKTLAQVFSCEFCEIS